MTEQATVERPPQTHLLTCGCLICGDWRDDMRRRGYRPIPARDWRGKELT